jgi:hypothetical protein
MAGKILILRWAGSSYDSLGGLLDLFAQEFRGLGLEVEIFFADGNDWPVQLVALLNTGQFVFAVTMSGIGADMKVDGTMVWEKTKVPLFNWNCDHPSHYPTRHIIRNQFVIHGYVFPDHARYNMAYLKPNGAAFAVHLGIPPRSLFASAPLPARSRNGRIMFSKTGGDTNATEAVWRTYAPVVREIIFAAAEELFARSTADFVPVLQRIAEPRGIFLAGDTKLAMMLIHQLDVYIRFKRANFVMASVLRFPVDVFGSGWDHVQWDGAQARFHQAIPWQAMIEQLPQYSGCLSINPLIDESVHDRAFFALAAGVPPISDSNAFSRTYMPELEPYAFGFTRERIEQAVEAVLNAPEEAIARTETTLQQISIPFGMRRAARQIVQFASLNALNARVIR